MVVGGGLNGFFVGAEGKTLLGLLDGVSVDSSVGSCVCTLCPSLVGTAEGAAGTVGEVVGKPVGRQPGTEGEHAGFSIVGDPVGGLIG